MRLPFTKELILELLARVRTVAKLSGTFPKDGPLRFGSKKSLPSNFAH